HKGCLNSELVKMRNGAFKYIIPALLLEAGYARLMLLGALEQHIVETITILLLSSAVYLISVGLILNDSQSGKSHRAKHLTRWLIAAGIIFRLTVWPLQPAFTDDVL